RTSENHWVDLCRLPEKNLRKIRVNQIGIVFQDPMSSLNPSLSCGFQIMEALRTCDKIPSQNLHEQCMNLLGGTGISDPERISRSYPFQLSGGQRQRVMIAMAIAGNPQLLIADEPTTALDVSLQKAVLELLKNLCASRNMSMIFISHDLRILKNIAPEIVIMHNGEMIEAGKTEHVLQNPQTEPSQILIRSIPPLDYRPSRLGLLGKVEKEKYSSVIPSSDNTEANTNKQNHILLEVKNLYAWYEKDKFPWGKHVYLALQDISFRLLKNETLGIIGESGSGKTTLARSILGLMPDVSGEIYFNNIPLHPPSRKMPRTLRKKMQIIFQDPYSSLNPRHTVQEILEEPLLIHENSPREERKKKIKLILDQVKLPETALSKQPHEFSGGQRQRIAIARALILNPDLVICDECVASLDVSIQAQILNLLNDLKDELGLSYLFISHDLAVVKYMAPHIIVLRNGRITDAGDTDTLWKNPGSDYLKNLIESLSIV
nr:ABC transporter ATP-binding protein [Bacteroidales bacterium]